MYAGDRRDFDFVQIGKRRIAVLHALGQQLRQRGVGNSEEVGGGVFFAPFVEANSGELAVFHLQSAYPGAQNTFSAPSPDFKLPATATICHCPSAHPPTPAGPVSTQ